MLRGKPVTPAWRVRTERWIRLHQVASTGSECSDREHSTQHMSKGGEIERKGRRRERERGKTINGLLNKWRNQLVMMESEQKCVKRNEGYWEGKNYKQYTYTYTQLYLHNQDKNISKWLTTYLKFVPTKTNRSPYALFIFLRQLLNLWAFLIAQLVKNPPAMQETSVWFLDQEDPLEKG